VNVSFERRALWLSTITIAGSLTLLIAVLSLVLYAVYVRNLDTQLNDSLEEIRVYVAGSGAPRRADELANAIAVRLVRPQAVVTVLDRSLRADVHWNPVTDQSARSSGTVSVKDRSQVKLSTPGSLGAQFFTGLGTLFGLKAVQAQFGAISVIVRPSESALVSTVTPFVAWLALAEVLALAFGIGLARVLTRQALRPLADVTAALERFASGDLTPSPVAIDRKNRLDALAVAYNGAIEQVALAFAERERAQAGMRQFIADAGHQLRTPLTVIRGFTAILRQGDLRDTGDYMRILDAINRQSIVLGSLIDKLIILERWEQAEDVQPAEPIDIAQLVDDVVSPIAEAHPDRIELHIGEAGAAAIDPSDLGEALTNLIDNALKYTHGPIDVRVRDTGRQILVEVVDQGPGMQADELHHVFDRFFRGPTRREVEGSGLGLSIARRAIERAGGSLTVVSAPETGSHFTIALPASAPRRLALPRATVGV